MGREIRRVPSNWEHPKYGDATYYPTDKSNKKDQYHPLYDEDYFVRAEQWIKESAEWQEGIHKSQIQGYGKDTKYFWDYEGPPPDLEYYRCLEHKTLFDGPADSYQIYETVSEGTPVSPKFTSLEDMISWLINEGYTKESATAFTESGYVPSMIVINNPGEPVKILIGIESAGSEKEE